LVNADFDDLVNDANAARPLTAGGTGGNSQITGWDGLTAQGTAVPSASTIVLDTVTGPWIDISGTTTITAVTLGNGKIRLARATGAFQLTASASLIVNNSTSVNYTTTAGDFLIFTAEGGVVRVSAVGSSPAATTSTAGTVKLATNALALGATDTTTTVTPANLAQERTLGAQNVNVGLSASVNASALTVSLTGIDGSTPSATDPVTVLFRNATIATGTPVSRLVTGSTSITVASTKTLGTSSSNVPFRIWIVAVDTGSGIELGVVNALSGTSIMALRAGIYSPTATPGNSAQVIYTTSGQTSKPIAILGWMEWASGLATAGTWASGPTTIKLWQPGDPLPGDTVQSAYSDYSTSATGTGIIPADNTIPQSTEGDQYMSQAITPMSASNVLRVASRALLGINGAAKFVTMALFRDAGANAIAVTANSDNGFLGQMLMYEAQAGAVTATTFKVRAGQDSSGGTVQFGSSSGTRLYGAIPFASLSVLEVMA
jgi:hypothetical protein